MKIKETKDQGFIEMYNPAMEAIRFPADPSYLEAFQSIAKQIIETQVGSSGVPEDAKLVLRSGNHSTVRLSPIAAAFAIDIVTLNWMSFKFAKNGNDALGQKASDEYYRRMAKLNNGRSGFSKEEVVLIHRYLD